MRTTVLSLAALLAGAATAAAADGYIGVQIKAGDLITKVDGKDFGDLQGFVAAIRACKPGAKIKLTLFRDGKEMELEVTVGEKPEP